MSRNADLMAARFACIWHTRAGPSPRQKPSVTSHLARPHGASMTWRPICRFRQTSEKTKHSLLRFLIEAKSERKKICGYGAPGKGNTLLNYCGIGPDLVDFTVDRNPYKHGRYTPGMHISILSVEALEAAKPDYVLILPWNLKDEIVMQMAHVGGWGGKFVVPIPEIQVISPREQRI